MTKYRYAQILYGKVHWICESEEPREFPPNLEFVEITEKSEIRVGWDYNKITEEFTAPVISEPEPVEPRPSLEEMQVETLLNTKYLVSRSELGLGGI